MGPRQEAIVIVLNWQQKFESITLSHLGIYEPTLPLNELFKSSQIIKWHRAICSKWGNLIH